MRNLKKNRDEEGFMCLKPQANGFFRNMLRKNENRFCQGPLDVWFSKRGCPLVTQPHAVFGVNTPIITVERYCKWYGIYYLKDSNPNTTPIELGRVDSLPAFDDWLDHTPKPKELVEYCIKNGIKMELQVYYAIATRWANGGAEPRMMYTSDLGYGADPMNDEDEERIREHIREAFKDYRMDDYPTKRQIEQVLFDVGEISLIN